MCFVRNPSIVRYIGSIFHPIGKGKHATDVRISLSVALLQEGMVFSLNQHHVDTRNTSFVSKVVCLTAIDRPVLPCRLSITDPDCSNYYVYMHITKCPIFRILFCIDLLTVTGE